MSLAGQDALVRRQDGYAMAALLTMLAVMSIVMGAALPVWQTEIRREREEELVFRGQQYVRAITLFQRRYPGTFPPNVDVLVQQKFLRKKYKDPITGEDFQLLRLGQVAQGAPGQPGGRAQGQGQGPGSESQTPSPQPAGLSQLPQGGAGPLGGIIGVTSKSTETSIRVYQGRSKYNQWPFVFNAAQGRPGGPGQQRPGAPGGRGPGGQAPGSRTPGPGPGQGPRPVSPQQPPDSPFGPRPPG